MTPGTETAASLAGTPVVRARAVSKLYGSTVALWNVDLDLQAGEAIAVAGPNGSGKSTLLRVLAGVTAATSGEVARQAGNARIRVALVSHRTHLLDALTPLENLMLTCRLARSAQDPRVVLRDLGVGALMHRPCRELSAGTVRRVAVARALTAGPHLLALDEPFAGLDREAGDLVEEALAGFVQAQGILVFSSHDEERAGAVAKRTVHLDRGRVIKTTVPSWA